MLGKLYLTTLQQSLVSQHLSRIFAILILPLRCPQHATFIQTSNRKTDGGFSNIQLNLQNAQHAEGMLLHVKRAQRVVQMSRIL